MLAAANVPTDVEEGRRGTADGSLGRCSPHTHTHTNTQVPFFAKKKFWTLNQVAFCHWSNKSSFEFLIRYWPDSWKMCRYEGFHKQAV